MRYNDVGCQKLKKERTMTEDDLTYSMKHSFAEFQKLLNNIDKQKINSSVGLYTYQEMLRFQCIAGTILEDFKDVANSIDQRNITHPLLRSLLEGWIWITYIHWENDENSKQSRFEELMNGFKIEYQKLFNDQNLPRKNELPAIPTNEDWSQLARPRNANDMLVAVKNDYGDKLDYLYFAYRIMSFDTHAKAAEALFLEAFQQPCSFIFIQPEKIINLIANNYIEVMNNHLATP